MRNACFCFSRPSILASRIHTKNICVQDTFLDTLFQDFILIVCENGRFGNRFKIQRGPRWCPASSKYFVLSKNAWLFPAVEGFVRDLFLQHSLGTPLAHFGPMLGLIWLHVGLISDSILFNFAFHWARFGKVLASKLGLVEMGRRNSRRHNNLVIQKTN